MVMTEEETLERAKIVNEKIKVLLAEAYNAGYRAGREYGLTSLPEFSPSSFLSEIRKGKRLQTER